MRGIYTFISVIINIIWQLSESVLLYGLWNLVVGDIFSLGDITYLQAICLHLFVDILLGNEILTIPEVDEEEE